MSGKADLTPVSFPPPDFLDTDEAPPRPAPDSQGDLAMRSKEEFDKYHPHGHQLRDGRSARIVAYMDNPQYPILAVVQGTSGKEIAVSYTIDGKRYLNEESPADLVNKPQLKKRAKGWINIYDIGYKFTSSGELLETEEQANKELARRSPFARIFVDVEEGEGL